MTSFKNDTRVFWSAAKELMVDTWRDRQIPWAMKILIGYPLLIGVMVFAAVLVSACHAYRRCVGRSPGSESHTDKTGSA